MRHLVMGCGEVGAALVEVLGCDGYDPQKGHKLPAGWQGGLLHICFPYAERDSFHNAVRGYQGVFKPDFTVIHSTVPIGTCDALDAHHSPVRGRHPHLATSLRHFVKYVGGPQAELLCAEFQKFGMDARPCPSARDTEAGKLIDLMQFASSILIEKEIHGFCEENGLNFDLVYGQFNATYNAGYLAMGMTEFIRPTLKHTEGPIGGHCVAQNMKWLPMESARRVLSENAALSMELPAC